MTDTEKLDYLWRRELEREAEELSERAAVLLREQIRFEGLASGRETQYDGSPVPVERRSEYVKMAEKAAERQRENELKARRIYDQLSTHEPS